MKRRALLVVALVSVVAQRSSGDTQPADLSVAKDWLAAAAKGSGSMSESSMGLPFTYRTTNKIKKCEGAVRDQAALAKWASCFRDDQKLLLKEIRSGNELQAASPRAADPKQLRAMAKSIPGDGSWLPAFINGDGITFTFLFKLNHSDGGTKITAVLLEEEVESG
jgi:hypothetical protein